MNARQLAQQARRIDEVRGQHPEAEIVINTIWGPHPQYDDIQAWCRAHPNQAKEARHARDRDQHPR